MTIQIAFTVPGIPVAKGRARAARRKGKGGKEYIAMATPEKTEVYENLVKLAAEAAMRTLQYPMLLGPVELRVSAFFPIPVSWSLKKQRAAALGDLIHQSRPDLDNVVKAIKDGCNSVAWKDDSQVADLVGRKRYGDPRVEVEIWGTC